MSEKGRKSDLLVCVGEERGKLSNQDNV